MEHSTEGRLVHVEKRRVDIEGAWAVLLKIGMVILPLVIMLQATNIANVYALRSDLNALEVWKQARMQDWDRAWKDIDTLKACSYKAMELRANDREEWKRDMQTITVRLEKLIQLIELHLNDIQSKKPLSLGP